MLYSSNELRNTCNYLILHIQAMDGPRIPFTLTERDVISVMRSWKGVQAKIIETGLLVFLRLLLLLLCTCFIIISRDCNGMLFR